MIDKINKKSNVRITTDVAKNIRFDTRRKNEIFYNIVVSEKRNYRK